MPTRFDSEVFYETHLDPDAVFGTEAVPIRNVPRHDVKALTTAFDLTVDNFRAEISFYDLDPVTVVYRAYEPTVAGAVLWLQDQAIATLGLLDRGHGDGIHHFHQILTNLAQRGNKPPRLLPKARLPTCRPALFVIGMNRENADTFLGLHRFTRALMVAFLYKHQRAWHERARQEHE